MFNFFRSKAKCKRFYDLSSNTFDLGGINAEILGKFNISMGQLKIDNHGHKEVSEELLKLDLHQYTLCESINSISNSDLRDQERIKIIEIQSKMMELLSGISTQVKVKEEKCLDHYNLIILYLNEVGEISNYQISQFGIEQDIPIENFLTNFPKLAKSMLNIDLKGKLSLAFLNDKTWANESDIMNAKPKKSKHEIAVIEEDLIRQYESDKSFLLTIGKTLMK